MENHFTTIMQGCYNPTQNDLVTTLSQSYKVVATLLRITYKFPYGRLMEMRYISGKMLAISLCARTQVKIHNKYTNKQES